ncbi:MAG TPA: lysylphosphatidylglycerol synthase domain-containing protein [Gemmatimonadales bacterium]|nr:lysylphosphatidylglycerol synthase domain-containing protein [Gemmatimonadales bacterium]
MNNRWIKLAGWILALVVGVFAVRTLLREWHALVTQTVTWHVRPLYLLGAVLLVLVNYAILIQAWRVMLAGWRQSLPFFESVRVWVVSGLGKYVPGKVWAVAGMAVMAQRGGVAAWAATASAVVLQALSVGTGAAVVGLAGSARLQAEAPWARIALISLIVASAAGLALLLWPPVTRRLLQLVRVSAPPEGSPGVRAVAVGLAANLVAWISYGTSLWLLAHGLLDVPTLSLRVAIGAFAASYVAGLLALFAPGGIGVRELVFLLMLDGVVGPGIAAALAIASRLLLTLTEIGTALPFLILQRGQRRAAD